MGNALRSHDDLVHIRGWTKDQIKASIKSLRNTASVYRVTKDDFARYFGGRNREVLTIFSDLDTDADGLVDIFEVFTVLILWSGIPWDDKQAILFDLFDLMGKGFLKIDELLLMGSVIVQTLAKFVKFDDTPYDHVDLQKLAQTAMPHTETQLTLDDFRLWYKKCEPLEQLRGFLEDHAARSAPDSVTSRMRMKIAYVELHSSRLFDRIERLQDRLPDFADACIEYVSAWGRRKRWDFLMQNLRQLIMKLHHVSEGMHTAYIDLETSLNEDEASGGMATVVAPHKRFKQEHMIKDLDSMRLESLTDYWEATDLLERMIELTEPSEMQASAGYGVDDTLDVINEDENEGMIDMSPPRVVEQRKIMRRIHADMLADTQEGGCFHKKSLPTPEANTASDKPDVTQVLEAMASPTASKPMPSRVETRDFEQTQAAGVTASSSSQPTLVAIADFEPPSTHQTQMLKLCVGDQVTVVGQDGRGWWYGKKENGKEGWFPPSYVQLESAHFSSGGAER